MRISYLGPAGTYNEDALRQARPGGFEPLIAATVHDAIVAVERGEADRALVPFENSIEGGVRETLDALAFDTESVTIVGEHDYPVSHCLIARAELPLAEIGALLSHPQASAQCRRFIRDELPGAELRATASTADAVRQVSSSREPWAALGARSAADIYGCAVLREGVEDGPDNITRFVWIAPVGTEPQGGGAWKTTLVFAELGEDRPGALVEALTEFSRREINLTRIESRPRRGGLGRYMFFLDLEGSARDPIVAEAIAGLGAKAESVRLLGSYPIG